MFRIELFPTHLWVTKKYNKNLGSMQWIDIKVHSIHAHAKQHLFKLTSKGLSLPSRSLVTKYMGRESFVRGCIWTPLNILGSFFPILKILKKMILNYTNASKTMYWSKLKFSVCLHDGLKRSHCSKIKREISPISRRSSPLVC
jgi:hypothetical protein